MSYNYFLAAILSEQTKKAILKYGLDPKDPRLQHTTPLENLHITVGYIGPIAEEVLTTVASCFKALEDFPPFQLSAGGVDFYGSRSNFKRYIGVAIFDPDEKLKQLNYLADQLLQKATDLSFRGSSRGFAPHITFQLLKHRLKSSERHLLIDQSRKNHKNPLQFDIQSLGLWYRNPKTQKYESVVTYLLRKT